MEINFFNEDLDYSPQNPGVLSSWLIQIAKNENTIIEDLNYIFCSDDYLHQMNVQYLNHDTYTDIITFDQSDNDLITGDIFISIDRVKENSISHNTTFDEELQRVMAHGLLHLIGYGDKSNDEAKLMREKENACLTLLEEMN